MGQKEKHKRRIAGWRSNPDWPHLEYPVNHRGSVIRWKDGDHIVKRFEKGVPITEYQFEKGVPITEYPKWRCTFCHGYVEIDSVPDWGKNTPCNNENCQRLTWMILPIEGRRNEGN